MFDWNDVRYFLAVAETGSTLAAARRLRVSQTTAARRVAALEAALGMTLFERRQSGYLLTPAGEALLPEARAVEAASGALSDAAAAQLREVRGTVRGDDRRDLRADGPDADPPRPTRGLSPIRIELETTYEIRDLAAGAADVALRSSAGILGNGVVGGRSAVAAGRCTAAAATQPRMVSRRRPRSCAATR
jgi:DNA-binding transcriptional LysR family regulator